MGAVADLYAARKDIVDFIDVPELAYVMVDGEGSPTGVLFQEAVASLYTVSYTMHFGVRRTNGAATRVMPLEARWWVDAPAASDDASGPPAPTDAWAGADADRWRWTAMIMQPEPINRAHYVAAVDQLRAKEPAVRVERTRFERWREGRSAQILHVGPYSNEQTTVRTLHAAIADAGARPCGHLHEIYLGDPRRSAPDGLRTILRQPILTAPVAVLGGAHGEDVRRVGRR
jgi:hypothetical protein